MVGESQDQWADWYQGWEPPAQSQQGLEEHLKYLGSLTIAAKPLEISNRWSALAEDDREVGTGCPDVSKTVGAALSSADGSLLPLEEGAGVSGTAGAASRSAGGSSATPSDRRRPDQPVSTPKDADAALRSDRHTKGAPGRKGPHFVSRGGASPTICGWKRHHRIRQAQRETRRQEETNGQPEMHQSLLFALDELQHDQGGETEHA